jgi:exodeoxyribonuclease V gamma subunit
LPSGNPLLTSLGRLNRDFTEVRLDLDERAGFVIQELPGRFIEPDGKEMLHTLQSDILHARHRGDGENPKEKVFAHDKSVQIHACHSAMREIEVLYDHLLERFEQDPTLKPRDILVMMPDVEKYGPFIHAVFDYPEVKQRFIPFSVADRRPTRDSPAIEAFLALLAVPGSRCTASEIFSLMELIPVRRRFALTEEEMILIREWITESGIRWGIDAAHRKAFQLPGLEANTWRAGLKRLLLGYAMSGKNQTLFEGIMPFDEVEGEGAEVLGRFISASEVIFGLAEELSRDRPLAEWPPVLGALIEQFFLADTVEEVADLRVVRLVLDQLRRTAEQAGNEEKIEFRVVRYYLQQSLDQGEQRGGFLTGGVTFCALQPMRSIPARIICLIGMGDQDFPRQSRTPGFDLMADDRKCGDRSVRDDDRYIFLEALLSARERLYISYLGRSAIDNEEIPPSVLVSELLDYLDQSLAFPGRKSSREWLLTDHRLHSFSPRYFDGKVRGLFSYSEANASASRSLRALTGERPPGFFAQPLSEPGEEARRVELNSLIDFFANPARHFIRRRLRLSLSEEDDALENNEPFGLTALESYPLKQELVAQALANKGMTSAELAARGVLPLGEMGLPHFQTLLSVAEAFRKKVEPELGGQRRDEPLLVDLRIDPYTLTGWIESIYGGRIVQYRSAVLKPSDRLRAWTSHLARCAGDSGAACETVLVGTDEIVRFFPIEDASTMIRTLLEIYWRGLSRALPFFPLSGLEYAKARHLNSPSAKTTPLGKALKVWRGSSRTDEGEKKNRYYSFVFSEGEPLDDEFTELAWQVFEPMLRNQRSTHENA